VEAAAAAAAAEGAAEGAAAPDKVPTPAFTPASTPAFTPAITELEQMRLAAAEGGGVEMAGATTTPAGSETEAVGSPGGAVSVDANREDGPKRLRR
jgi:hypothetical protein